MAQKIRSDSGELMPFNDDGSEVNTRSDQSEENDPMGRLLAGVEEASYDDVNYSNSLSDDELTNDAAGQEQVVLQSENIRLRAQLLQAQKRLLAYEEANRSAPPLKMKGKFERETTPSKLKPKKSVQQLKQAFSEGDWRAKAPQHSRHRPQRRRWSLSGVSASRRPGSDRQTRANGDMNVEELLHDNTTVVYHDQSDHNESSRGLHHRRGDSYHKMNGNVTQSFTPRHYKSHDSFGDGGDDFDDEYNQGDLGHTEESISAIEIGDDDDGNDDDEDPFDVTFYENMKDRAIWLVGLMVMQSASSFIIKRNESVLEEHGVIVQFLTMLVGAGGNAGNQASVRVIRGLAIGAVTDDNATDFLRRELLMAVALAMIVGVCGCLRAVVFFVPLAETLAITMSLWCIVITSIGIGASLPLAMKYVGIDPANSSTSIQVIMDILGVTITLWISKLLLSSAGALLDGKE